MAYPESLGSLSPKGWEFDPYTYGVGNLNSNLDFVLRVPVIEQGLINQDGG